MSEFDIPAAFEAEQRGLEAAYLASDDPIVQSGFHGGPARWRAERSPILDAVDGDGDLLDIGCANGYLLSCLVAWGRERGRTLTPHGVDLGPRLIALAKARHPGLEENFHVADIHEWRPVRRYRYVYSIVHVVPATSLAPYARGLLDRVVAPGGRLILGAYGSRSRVLPPFDITGALASHGIPIAGRSRGGEPPLSTFVWMERP